METREFTIKGERKVLIKKESTDKIVVVCAIDGIKAELGLSYNDVNDRDKSFNEFTSDHALVSFQTIENFLKKNK